jgi:serine/threonine-protein kinase
VALEMLEGRTLEGLITARGRLSVEDTIQVGRQIAEALAFGHARGVVHRDVKPSNVFVVKDELGREVIKLVDFGIARVHGDEAGEPVRPAGAEKLTKVGEVIGTPEYMAPEQLLGKEVIDHRCDVYGTAVTLYECLTGDVPFGGTYADILMKVLGRGAKPPRVRAARADVPQAVAEAIEKGLAPEADERWADCLAFADALIAAGGVGAQPSTLFEEKVRVAPAVPPPVPDIARRKHPRAPYVTPVHVVASIAGDGPAEGRSEDVSEAGLLVVAEGGWKSGEEVLLRFALPLSGIMEQVPAVVRWSRAGRGGRTASGLEFTALSEAARHVIASYVEMMR